MRLLLNDLAVIFIPVCSQPAAISPDREPGIICAAFEWCRLVRFAAHLRLARFSGRFFFMTRLRPLKWFTISVDIGNHEVRHKFAEAQVPSLPVRTAVRRFRDQPETAPLRPAGDKL